MGRWLACEESIAQPPFSPTPKVKLQILVGPSALENLAHLETLIYLCQYLILIRLPHWSVSSMRAGAQLVFARSIQHWVIVNTGLIKQASTC